MNSRSFVPCTCQDGIPCPICELFKNTGMMQPEKKFAVNTIDRVTGQTRVMMMSESAYNNMVRKVERKSFWQRIVLLIKEFFVRLFVRLFTRG